MFWGVPKTTKKSEIELYVISKARALRVSAKLTQSELAFRLGVSNGFVGQVESSNSPSKYNLNHVDKLAEIFECSPKDFLPVDKINK